MAHNGKITFINLFANNGEYHQEMHSADSSCVFANERNIIAQLS